MLKFLNLEPELFGLDISESSLKFIKLSKKHNFFNIDYSNQVNLPAGIISEGVIKNEAALVEIIKKVFKSAKYKGLSTKYVSASLPEEKSFLEVIQMPKMTEKELESAVLFEAENYVPMPIDKLYLDFKVINQNIESLNHVDVLIVAMPKTTVDSYNSCLKKAGLIPTVLEVESQTIVRSLVKKETSLIPLVLIDLGKDDTDFIIFSGDSIRFTCSIPISSQQITEAISSEMNISLAEAEKIKINFNLTKKNDSLESQKIASIIESILSNLAGEIKKYLDFHRDHISHEHSINKNSIDGEKIILSGGGSELEGITEFLFQKLKIPVELADPWVNVPFKNNKKFVLSGKRSLSFSKAIGLALGSINNVNKK